MRKWNLPSIFFFAVAAALSSWIGWIDALAQNGPGGKEMKGINELVILSNQASLALEKFALERMLGEESAEELQQQVTKHGAD